MPTSYTIFQEAHPARERIVAASRRYIGLSYSRWQSRAVWNAASGRMEGQTDCLRFLLFIARDLGYLASDFDVNLARPQPKLSRDQAMWELLRANLDEVPIDEALPGDVLLFIYADLNADNTEVHHVGIQSSTRPFPFGSFIDCEDFDADGQGCVSERRMDGLQRKRLASVWRLRGIVERGIVEGES